MPNSAHILFFQICCTVVMNLVSTGLAITAIVLYSVNISSIRYVDDCSPREDPYGYRYGYGYGYYTTTVSPEKKDLLEEMMENCKRRRHFYMVCHFLNKNKMMFYIICLYYKIMFVNKLR